MSLHIPKLLNNPLALASAAFIIHIGAATAADSPGDIQQQMRELLTGTRATHVVPQSRPHDAKVTPPVVDSQEFVKRLLLGTAAYGVGGAETSKRPEVTGASSKTAAQKGPVASIDMQAAVRQLLLGQPHANDAS